MPTINARARRVLSQVVDVYYQTCEPVGSTSICRTRELPYSAATIRHILGDLDEQGLLAQPHTSAGRIPTDLGYRHYVDDIAKVFMPLNDWDTRRVDLHLLGIQDPTKALATVASILHERTRLISFYAAAKHTAWKLRHIVLEPIDTKQVLAVLITGGGQALEHMMDFGDRPYTEPLLKKIENYVNLHFAGLSLEEMRWSLASTPAVPREHDVLLAEANRLIQQLEDAVRRSEDIHFIGFETMIEAPEFRDVDAIRRLYTLVRDRHRIQSIASQAAIEHRDQVHIFIGREFQDPELHDLSTCFTRLMDGERNLGYVGVLGPTRMPYVTSYRLLSYARFKVATEFNVS